MGQLKKISRPSIVALSRFSISKVLFLLVVSVLPKIIFAQISFDDIASINTLQSFQRVVIENKFELSTSTNDTMEKMGFEPTTS